MFNDDLIGILACPACKNEIHKEGEALKCDQCGRKYPINNGIPVMLVDEAEQN